MEPKTTLVPLHPEVGGQACVALVVVDRGLPKVEFKPCGFHSAAVQTYRALQSLQNQEGHFGHFPSVATPCNQICLDAQEALARAEGRPTASELEHRLLNP